MRKISPKLYRRFRHVHQIGGHFVIQQLQASPVTGCFLDVYFYGLSFMWLSGTMRQTFAVSGLLTAAVFAFMAIDRPIFLIPAGLAYGLTKLGIRQIPWKG